MKKIYCLLVIAFVFLGCKSKQEACYQVQALTAYGTVIEDRYDCMKYVKNYGNDFQSAYDNLQSTINGLKDRLYEDNKNIEDWDADRIEVRKVQCAVRNTPDDTLEYTSVDIYMYNSLYKGYIIAYFFWVIDSKGNAYARQSTED